MKINQVEELVGIRYGSSAVMQGAAEVVAYGTAVKIIEQQKQIFAVSTGRNDPKVVPAFLWGMEWAEQLL